ncbi:MAG: hypothetical protein ACK4SZ_15520 [Allosphingosinicella sp.]|uniref:hypothetical protein n=1 Tax=Allosphingosinicella sp. TaxID=2823234 RepID=UPI00392C4E71
MNANDWTGNLLGAAGALFFSLLLVAAAVGPAVDAAAQVRAEVPAAGAPHA